MLTPTISIETAHGVVTLPFGTNHRYLRVKGTLTVTCAIIGSPPIAISLEADINPDGTTQVRSVHPSRIGDSNQLVLTNHEGTISEAQR
ncbi:hypothetical protein ACTGY2_11020, partial [Streptococcus suis]